MACTDYASGDALIGSVSSANAQDFVTCAFIGTQAGDGLGVWLWPTFVIGALMAGTFAATRSMVPPIILMLVLGPFVVATLPSAGANLLAIGGLMVVPSVLFLLFLRFKQARP